MLDNNTCTMVSDCLDDYVFEWLYDLFNSIKSMSAGVVNIACQHCNSNEKEKSPKVILPYGGVYSILRYYAIRS